MIYYNPLTNNNKVYLNSSVIIDDITYTNITEEKLLELNYLPLISVPLNKFERYSGNILYDENNNNYYYEIENIDIEEAKDLLRDSVGETRYGIEFSPIEYNGILLHTDINSQFKIQMAIINEYSGIWKGINGYINVTPEILTEISTLLITRTSSIFNQENNFVNQINAITDIEAVKNYSFIFLT